MHRGAQQNKCYKKNKVGLPDFSFGLQMFRKLLVNVPAPSPCFFLLSFGLSQKKVKSTGISILDPASCFRKNAKETSQQGLGLPSRSLRSGLASHRQGSTLFRDARPEALVRLESIESRRLFLRNAFDATLSGCLRHLSKKLPLLYP